ncbi:retrovirus-related pol polyprotein from transposon TNT 1-94 [Tanacetum coccineum]
MINDTGTGSVTKSDGTLNDATPRVDASVAKRWSGGGSGVKEKDLNRNKKNTSSGIGVFTDSNDTMNDDTLISVASTNQEGVTPYVVDMTVETEKQTLWKILLFWDLFHHYLHLWEETEFSYFVYTGGNGIDVVVPVESIRAINERFANTAYGFFLGKKVAYHVVANYVRNTWGEHGIVCSMFSPSTGLFSFQFSTMDGLDAMLENGPWSSYARAMIELRADVELKDNIVMAILKITREGHYTCNVRVEYVWKPPRCSSCKNFGHIHEECLKNTGAGEKKTVKKPNQTSRGVPVTSIKTPYQGGLG